MGDESRSYGCEPIEGIASDCVTLPRYDRQTGKWTMKKGPVYDIIDRPRGGTRARKKAALAGGFFTWDVWCGRDAPSARGVAGQLDLDAFFLLEAAVVLAQDLQHLRPRELRRDGIAL